MSKTVYLHELISVEDAEINKIGSIYYADITAKFSINDGEEEVLDDILTLNTEVEVGSGAFLDKNVNHWSKEDIIEYINLTRSTTLGVFGQFLEKYPEIKNIEKSVKESEDVNLGKVPKLRM